MVWSLSMKNDFIAIILPHSLASSESNFKENDELLTEFERNGWGVQRVKNNPIFKVAKSGSDMWVGMTRFVVALMTSRSTWGVIQTSSCMMGKSKGSDDSVTKGLYFSLKMLFVCISFSFVSTDSLSQFDATALLR